MPKCRTFSCLVKILNLHRKIKFCNIWEWWFFFVVCLQHLKTRLLLRNSRISNLGHVFEFRTCFPIWFTEQKLFSFIKLFIRIRFNYGKLLKNTDLILYRIIHKKLSHFLFVGDIQMFVELTLDFIFVFLNPRNIDKLKKKGVKNIIN